jgi:hypothetical protein
VHCLTQNEKINPLGSQSYSIIVLGKKSNIKAKNSQF